MDVAGGRQVLDGLEPDTEYSLALSADHYFEQVDSVRFNEAGAASHELVLVPRPGSIRIHVQTPHVQITVNAEGSGEGQSFTDTFPWPDPTQDKSYDTTIPAGVVHVHVARAGFSSGDATRTLAPEGSETFEFAPLAEILGEVAVQVEAEPRDGFDVVVVDDRGEQLGHGTTDATGALVLKVREGRHTLRATKTGYREFSTSIDVGHDATTPSPVVVSTAALEVFVTVEGAGGTFFRIEQMVDGEWTTVGAPRRIPEDATRFPRAISLAPGRYRVVWADHEKPFELAAGTAETKLTLE